MYVINSSSSKFSVGKKIVVIKIYNNGSINLNIGDTGLIIGASYMDLPDMGLFNIRIIDMKFNNQTIHMGEQVAEEYIDTI